MALSKKPYKGTRDFFPIQKRELDFVFNKMRHAAQLFGYEPYDGPMLEEVELYKAKSGEELINDQIYSFHDRGDRFVAMRPEMTPTVARMVAQIHKETPRPIRWFSIPNLYRYERPQRGRLREHWQFNLDIFGAPDKLGELEVLQVLIELMKSFGATEQHFKIFLNDRQLVDCFCKNILKLDADSSQKLYKIIDASKKIPAESVQEKLSSLGLDGEQIHKVNEYLKLNSFLSVEEYIQKYKLKVSGLKDFLDSIISLGLDKYISYDPQIVRGLDYYTGIVFELFDLNPENKRAICGGGAYANLLQIFNEKPLPGVGFGLGDVTLCDFLRTHELMPSFKIPENDIFISFQVEEALPLALQLATQFRALGLFTILQLDKCKMNKVFKLCEQKGAKFLVLINKDEVSKKTFILKNLNNKEQKEFPLHIEKEEILNFMSEI